MGEIGIAPNLFRHRLRFWEIRSIIRGFNRRSRDIWSSTRWSTYHIMASFSGGKNLAESGVHGPMDLMQFPWEKEAPPPLTPEEESELQAEMDAINAANSAVNPKP